ncbi:hypothetical protein [Gordonia sihwensis]|uniref:hypothetical protein n=1 Tax=Gordonia sihwensis TaxID=173559 RepID=UPI003D982A43
MAQLRFRNLDVSPDDPVEQWGVEGLLAAVDRGSLMHWRRISAAVEADPNGVVAEDLAEALDLAEDAGVVAGLRRMLEQAQQCR